MDKELIIILYKIDVTNMPRSVVEEMLRKLKEQYSLTDDLELKKRYIIREIILPGKYTESDVKIIYPVSNYKTDMDLIDEISEKVKSDSTLNSQWNNLIRTLKLKKINEL